MLHMWNEIPLRPLYQRGVGGFWRRLLLQPAQAEIFDLKKLIDPVFPTFPAEAGFLHST